MFTTAAAKTGTANEIEVAVDNGVVILTGWVDSFVTKWRAERAALRVRGVRAVVNEIEVRLPAAFQRASVGIAPERIGPGQG